MQLQTLTHDSVASALQDIISLLVVTGVFTRGKLGTMPRKKSEKPFKQSFQGKKRREIQEEHEAIQDSQEPAPLPPENFGNAYNPDNNDQKQKGQAHPADLLQPEEHKGDDKALSDGAKEDTTSAGSNLQVMRGKMNLLSSRDTEGFDKLQQSARVDKGRNVRSLTVGARSCLSYQAEVSSSKQSSRDVQGHSSQLASIPPATAKQCATPFQAMASQPFQVTASRPFWLRDTLALGKLMWHH